MQLDFKALVTHETKNDLLLLLLRRNEMKAAAAANFQERLDP